MAGLDLENLKQIADAFKTMDGDYKMRYGRSQVQALQHLDIELPALAESDRAAVAYLISRIIRTLLTAHMVDISDLLLNTATGYALAAVRLLGMEEE